MENNNPDIEKFDAFLKDVNNLKNTKKDIKEKIQNYFNSLPKEQSDYSIYMNFENIIHKRNKA